MENEDRAPIEVDGLQGSQGQLSLLASYEHLVRGGGVGRDVDVGSDHLDAMAGEPSVSGRYSEGEREQPWPERA